MLSHRAKGGRELIFTGYLNAKKRGKKRFLRISIFYMGGHPEGAAGQSLTVPLVAAILGKA